MKESGLHSEFSYPKKNSTVFKFLSICYRIGYMNNYSVDEITTKSSLFIVFVQIVNVTIMERPWPQGREDVFQR